MKNNGDYNGMLVSPVFSGEIVIHMEKDRLDFQAAQEMYSLDFALIAEIRAVNFRVLLTTSDGNFEIFQLGYDFDGFYEALYRAFCDRSQEALFVNGDPLIEAEGEYAYNDMLGVQKGTALLRLFEDCITILPANEGGRRIPLCFVTEVTQENFTINITLDTKEQYSLIRMGRKTDAFFDLLKTHRLQAVSRYKADLAKIEQGKENDPDEIKTRYETLITVCGKEQVVRGVFAPTDEKERNEPAENEKPLSFWFAAVTRDRAAVELSTGEKTATYLYRFREDPAAFMQQLRHAMEAVKDHREVIYLEEILPEKSPLYFMAIQRSAALHFLRGAMTGRLIHNESWAERIAAFLTK